MEALDIAPAIIDETFKLTKRISTIDHIYYYTSLDTLINGILVDKPTANQEVCLWATRWSHMNDSQEITSALDLLRSGNMPNDILKDHEDYINNLHVICFSRNKDKLQMWNGYGKRGYGVMLAFDFKQLLSYYPNILKPCIYENSKSDSKILRKIIDCDFSDVFHNSSRDRQLIAAFLCMLLYISLRKNSAYAYEREIRLTGIGVPLLSPPMNSKYRVQDGLIIPYIPVYFPKNILKQIWLGPCLEHDRNKVILEEILKSKGFNAEVICSNKPYRG